MQAASRSDPHQRRSAWNNFINMEPEGDDSKPLGQREKPLAVVDDCIAENDAGGDFQNKHFPFTNTSLTGHLLMSSIGLVY
jgi:hypothetical protein